MGIYGMSADGPWAHFCSIEFYKVGVSACACHDNRWIKSGNGMDGVLSINYAASSNMENAHLLEGKLLLIMRI